MALLPFQTSQDLAFQGYDLSAAILYTIAYSDIFDFPLQANEIQRFLLAFRADAHEVSKALASMSGQIAGNGEYYALHGRESLFALRKSRAAHAAKLWPAALHLGRWIGGLPFVRMVAVTGALAANNVEPGADLDYLIVTKPGWLWLCRAMILAINRATRLFSPHAEICPNYMITEKSLGLQDKDLFTAQELTRMLPIVGHDVYATMRAQNSWTEEFLPNASGAPRTEINPSGVGRFKPFVEFTLTVLPVALLEKWEMRRKIAKFVRQNQMNAETRFSADLCKGHFDGHKEQTMRAFQSRLAALKINQQ